MRFKGVWEEIALELRIRIRALERYQETRREAKLLGYTTHITGFSFGPEPIDCWFEYDSERTEQ